MATKKEKEAAKKAAKKATNKSNTTLVATKNKIKTDVPLLNAPEDIDASKFNVTADMVDAEQVDLTDPNFNFDKITANKITAGRLADRVMTAADYTLLDPADVQAEYGDITRDETRKNAALSSDLALDAIDTELKGLLNYAPTAANLQRQQVALDNTTNQSERLRMLEAADPNITKDLSSQRDRLTAYAEGRVPDSITDRQLELGIQSGAADRAAVGGFGAGSSAAMKAGQLMSAEQRIALSQYGDKALSANIDQRTGTLLAPQQMATGGASISVMPSMSAGQAAMAIASEANSGMITAKDALASKTQQGQFKSELQQDANKTNLMVQSDKDLNQARLDLEADTTSEANRLGAETTNADNSIRTQIAGKEINSAERRFNAELKTNTAVGNADRSFQAANANAGRSLEVATTNRAVKLEVEKTNKTLVFQDQQRIKSEKFTAGQNAASRAASGAASAASAANNAAAIAAQKEAADADRAFQLQQQQMALDLYYQNREDAQSSANWGAAGTVISRLPDIISTGTDIINGIGDLF